MRKKLRKITSVCLTVIMMLGVLTIAPISVIAANNNQQTAKSISTNTTYIGNLSTRNEEDYYKFSVNSSSKVSINFSHAVDESNREWGICLYDLNNNLLTDLTSGGQESNVNSCNVGIPYGTYYVKVYYPNRLYTKYSNIDYKLKVNSSSESYWEKEINDEFKKANTIQLNTTYSGSLRNRNDVDLYKFTLNSSSKVSINFSHAVDESDREWGICLYDSNNNLLTDLTSGGQKSNVSSKNVSITYGTYYIKIYYPNRLYTKYSNIDYYFKVTITQTLATPTITNLQNTADGIRISWNKVSGAYGYRLYYKYPGKDWKRFKDTTATSFTDTGVSAGRTETYTIRCIDKDGNTISGYNSSGWSKKYEPITPTITKLENTSDGIKISWNKIAGVYGYRLYYKYPGKDWKRFKDTTSTSFTDTGVSLGRTETYTIRCIDKNGNTISGYNPSGWSKTYSLPSSIPQITKLENTSSGIKISWNKVSGAYGYRLYYKYPGKDWKRFKDTTSTSFTDTGVSAGRTETYTIRCIDKNGNTISGYYSNGWSKKYEPVTPTITKLEKTSNGVKISWNPVAGVYGYRLYYKYPGQDWKRFKDTAGTSFTDTGVKAGRTETYTIRCIDKDGNTISGYNPNGWSITY